MRTAPTNKKVRELITAVKEGRIIPRPEFQRRLVWSRQDKNHFLDSVLRGYPFPEIYLADGSVDLETGAGTQLLVDGLQRVSTMIQYFDGDPDLRLTSVPYYRDLTPDKKAEFLQYDVAVRDLGAISQDEVIEVFRRINATKYALHDIEINNALYGGQLKLFSEKLASDEFFEKHNVFRSSDYKRMGDLRYAIGLVTTFMGGYSNRDDLFEPYLARYNDDFPEADELSARFARVFEFIEECGFSPDSRIWRKADLFTAIVELDTLLTMTGGALQPGVVVTRLTDFFESIDRRSVDSNTMAGVYYKAAVQASNDRSNRIRRGEILAAVIVGQPEKVALDDLVEPTELR